MKGKMLSMEKNLASYMEKSKKDLTAEDTKMVEGLQKLQTAIKKIDPNVSFTAPKATPAKITPASITPNLQNRQSKQHPTLSNHRQNRPKSQYMTPEL